MWHRIWEQLPQCGVYAIMHFFPLGFLAGGGGLTAILSAARLGVQLRFDTHEQHG